MSNRPVPKPRPPPKPDINAVGKKPLIPPKPQRRPPPSAPTPDTKNDINSNAPPKRPFKPVHLSPKSKNDVVNNNDVMESAKLKHVNKDMYDDVRVDAEDRADNNANINEEDLYDDIICTDASNKPDTKSSTNEDIISSTKKSQASKPLPPSKPPPKLPSKSISEITQKLKDVPVFPVKESSETLSIKPTPATRTSPQASPLPRKTSLGKKIEPIDGQGGEVQGNSVVQDQAGEDREEQKTTVTHRPQPPPKPRWVKALSKVITDDISTSSPLQEGSSSIENGTNSDGSTSQACDIVENNKLNDDKQTNDYNVTNDGTTVVDDQLDSKPSRPIKKRVATRRQPPGRTHATSVAISISEAIKRRPPPPPPEDGSPPKRAGSLKGPQIPKDHLRVTRSDAIHKSSSTGNIPKTAEEQSLYSYAYDHTFIPVSLKTPKDSAVNNIPVVTEERSSYAEPDASAVAGFMDGLKNKDLMGVSDGTYEIPAAEGISDGTYEIPAEEGVSDGTYEIPDEKGIQSSESQSYISEAEYVLPDDIIKDDDDNEDSDVSDSDNEHEYEIPTESPPPVPPHRSRSPLRSGSYDITSPDDEESDEDDDYVEPPDAQGSSCEEDLDEFSDSFIADDDESTFEEPLYQVYTARTLKRDRTLSRKRTDSDQNETSFEDLTKGTLRNMRMLWCEVPEVIASGILETIDTNERKRQEAMFEVITSEASYLKSLKILQSHFISSDELTPGTPQCVIEKAQYHILFSNVRVVVEASQKFLDRLRQRSSESLVVSTISDIIEEFASKEFEVYVKYCSNQIYQDRVLKELRKLPRFLEGMEKLEKSAAAQCLSLQSFLVLPMQRITRLPLLVDAICHRCEPGSDEFIKTDAALKAVHKVVRNCNEGARKMERMEEMVALQPQIEFTSRPIALVSANRWLLRRGEVVLVIEQTKSPISKKKLKLKPVYMFLFNDTLLITKKKGENRYRVLDYAARNMTKVEESSDPSIQLDYMLSLILLENCNNKTKDFLLCAESQTDKTRWLEAFNPPKAEQEGEKVYGAWDCPQVQAIHDYTPQQPDELALHEGDVINVQRKLPDGWHYGERLCDGVCGWFPANYTENILNEHVRARNLLQRYRLLAASKHLIGAVQTMKTPKTSKLTLKGISATLKEPKRDAFS